MDTISSTGSNVLPFEIDIDEAIADLDRLFAESRHTELETFLDEAYATDDISNQHNALSDEEYDLEKPDDWPEGVPVPKHKDFGIPEIVFVYRDQASNPVSIVCRWDLEREGKKRKEIRPYSKIDGRWIWKAITEDKPLYNLDMLTRNYSKPTYVAEGEKAADALAKLNPDAVVTTIQGGAKATAKADLSPLKGCEVVIFPDNDEAGERFASDLARRLHKVGANSIRIVDTEAWGRTEINEGKVQWNERDKCPDKWDAANALDEGWTAESFASIVDRIKNDDPTFAPFSFPKRWPFITRGNDIVQVRKKVEESKDGKLYFYSYEPVFTKIDVLGRFTDGKGKSHGHVVRIGQDQFPVYAHQFVGTDFNDVAKSLLDRGVKKLCHSDVQFKNALQEYLQNHPNDTDILVADATGWHLDGVFVTPTWCEGSDANYFFDCNDEQEKAFAQSGSLEDWKKNVAGPAALQRNLVFTIGLALAGPLLQPLGRDGFGIHVYGPSSTGKSTASFVATSVWGNPLHQNKTWNTTATALEVTASQSNGCLLSLDEISQGNPDDVFKAGYELANGAGKGRGKADGGMRERRKWLLVFLSNGENSFEAAVKTNFRKDAMAGQKARIVSIPVESESALGVFDSVPHGIDPSTFADSFKQAALSYHGVAGQAFVKALTAKDNNALDRIKTLESEAYDLLVSELDDADGQVKRVARHFALIAATGEAAQEWGILPWDSGTSLAAAQALFKRWIDHRGGMGADEDMQAVRNAEVFLTQQGDSRFADKDANIPAKSHDLAGYSYKDAHGETVYLVFSEVFKNEICGQLNPKQACNALIDAGMLSSGPGGGHTKQVRITGHSRLRFYELTLPDHN